MESPVQRCSRIITALEDLTGQEEAALANRDYVVLLSLQERTAPLVEYLITDGATHVRQPTLRGRVEAVHARRQQTGDRLAVAMADNRRDFQQAQLAQRRAAQVGPAYGHVHASTPRWQAQG
jgi:hypothetical protein